MLALRHPNLYGQVATLAGYFTIDDPDGIFGDDPAVESAYNPTDLIALAPRVRWLLIEATNDDLELTAHASESYATLLRAHGATVELRRTPAITTTPGRRHSCPPSLSSWPPVGSPAEIRPLICAGGGRRAR